jgi:uncharacterized protein (TIGR02145 family)
VDERLDPKQKKMKNKVLLSVLLILLPSLYLVAQKTGNFTDARDNTIYKTVKIAKQTWMAENLNVSIFRNGDTIREAKSAEDWDNARMLFEPAWCYYNFDPVNGEKYGKLYNWYAVHDNDGLAPEGWYIPGSTGWSALTDYLGATAGKKMKSTEGWFEGGNGTGESGFTALPGGGIDNTGTFFYIEKAAFFWTSTENYDGSAACIVLGYKDTIAGYANNKTSCGFSVRCAKY